MRRNRLNRHAVVRRGKRIDKKRHAMMYDMCTNTDLLRQHLEETSGEFGWWSRHHPRNGGYEYWRVYYLSGARRFAKRQTNKVLRGLYREMIKHMDPDDVPALKNSDYQKTFDYNWTIW